MDRDEEQPRTPDVDVEREERVRALSEDGRKRYASLLERLSQ